MRLPLPNQQIAFAKALEDHRGKCLQAALLETVPRLSIAAIDRQLAEFVDAADLALLAGKGLRGELVFPLPAVLEANPRLVAYYRLLLGYSQKAFYGSRTGLSLYKRAEEGAGLSAPAREQLPEFCRLLAGAASSLLKGLDAHRLTAMLLHELTLLSLGPQLRGSANNLIGSEGIRQVFGMIRDIVGNKATIIDEATGVMELRNAAGRTVRICFSSDPDITIQEVLSKHNTKLVIAIEIKSGADFSNIHNRLGEAEKSHQKAKAKGYNECWTIVNTQRLDLQAAKAESPTTSRFFALPMLLDQGSEEFRDFREHVEYYAGIATSTP